MNKNKLLGLIVLGLVVLGLGYFFFFDKSDKPEDETDPKKASLTFVAGESLSYRLTNKTIILPAKSNPFFKKMKIDTLSDLEVLVFKEAGAVYLAMQFHALDFVLQQKGKDQKIKAEELILEPFLVTLRDGAEIDDILFSYKLDEEKRAQITGVIQTLQIAFREGKNQWTEAEKNSNGLYESRYQVKYADGITTLNKSTLGYKQLASTQSSIEIKKSDITAVADGKSWFKEVDYLQEELYSAKGKVMMDSRVVTQLQRVPNQANLKLTKFKNIDALRKYLGRSSSGTEKDDNNVTTRAKRVKTFFDCMESGKCNFLNIQKDLKAYLLAHPDDYYLVLNLIKDEKYKEYHHRLINMLRDLGTPEAQVAILEIIQSDAFTQSNRTQAAVTIGFLREPTKETIESMKSLKKSGLLGKQEETALYYALGNIASGSQEAYDEIAPEIIKDLQDSASAADTIHALSALENTENNDIIKHVKPYLEDTNVAIRRGAVEALRLTSSPEATEALYTHLQGEEYDLVINAIAFSMHNKKDLTPEMISAVSVKASNKIKKSNDTLMMKSIDFLVAKSKENPDAKNALKVMMGKNLSIEARRKIIRGF